MKKTFAILLVLLTTFHPASFGQVLTSENGDTTRKLPKLHHLLSANFTVASSDLTLEDSEEWTSDWFCYDMVLKSKKLPCFVAIDFIERQPFSPGVFGLLSKLPQIRRIISTSYPYKYALTHDSIEVYIHFVNYRSLSSKARKSLKENLIETKLHKTLPSLRNAVLMDINDTESGQRWIVLNNGNALLWSYSGNKVLDIDLDQIENFKVGTNNYSYQIIDKNGSPISN